MHNPISTKKLRNWLFILKSNQPPPEEFRPKSQFVLAIRKAYVTNQPKIPTSILNKIFIYFFFAGFLNAFQNSLAFFILFLCINFKASSFSFSSKYS